MPKTPSAPIRLAAAPKIQPDCRGAGVPSQDGENGAGQTKADQPQRIRREPEDSAGGADPEPVWTGGDPPGRVVAISPEWPPRPGAKQRARRRCGLSAKARRSRRSAKRRGPATISSFDKAGRLRIRCGARSRNISSASMMAAGIRRAARQIKIDRQDTFEPVAAGISAAGNAARDGAGADRHHPTRLGHRLVGALQRLAHRVGDGTGDQQQIGKARRRGKENPETVQIVERVVERLQLRFAAVARAGIDMADMQTASKPLRERGLRLRATSRRRPVSTRSDRSRVPNAQSDEAVAASLGQASTQSWQTTQRP